MINIGTLLAAIELTDQMSPVVQNCIAGLQRFDSSTEMTSIQVRTLGTTLGLTSVKMAEMGVSSRMTDAQLRQLTDTTRMTSYQMTLLGRGLSEIGVLATGLTLAIGTVLNTVLDVGGEFESQMTKVVTLAGATRIQVDEMTGSVLKLAEASGVGPSELAKGLYVLMSTGMETSAAMESLRVASEMTALGMGNMHDTTLAVTGAVFAYREQNLTAAEAANILIKAVQLGNMEIQDLTPAIARVNPIAAALGVSFQDVAAGIATFTHAGVDSAVAATGMRAMLNNILTDSVKTEKGFTALSQALKDNSISMVNFRKDMDTKGFTTAMVELAEKVTNAGQAGVKAFGSIFPNIRALTEALFVFKNNGGMVVDMLKDMNNGTDELALGTAELHKTWKWQWDQMKVSVEKVWIELSTSLLPIFKNLLSVVSGGMIIIKGFVEVFNAFHPIIQYTILGIAGFIAVLGPTILLAGQFIMAIGNIRRAFESWNAIAILATGTTHTLGSAMLAFLLNPWTLAIVGISALVAALVYFTRDTKINTEAAHNAIAAHKEHLESLKKLQAELDPTTTKTRSLHDIAQSLVKLAPESIGAIGGQTVAYKDLTAAIDLKNQSEMFGLKIQYDVVVTKIAQLVAEQKNAIAAQEALQQSISRGRGYGALDLPFNQYTMDKMKAEHANKVLLVGNVTKALEAEIIVEESLHRTISKSYDAHKKNNEAIAAAALEEEKRTRTVLSGALAEQSLLEKVAALDSTQRAAITSGKALGLAHKDILSAMIEEGIAGETTVKVIDTYVRQIHLAASATKNLAKEQKTLTEAGDALDRINAQLVEHGVDLEKVASLSNEEWAKLAISFGISITDIGKATGISAGNLQMWQKAFKEGATAEADFIRDMITAQNQIEALTASTAALQIKADGDLYAAKIASVETWRVKVTNALDKLNIDDEKRGEARVAIEKEVQARIAVILANRAEKQRELNDYLKELDLKYIAETAKLWEQYAAIVLKTELDTGTAKLHAIQAQFTKEESVIKIHATRSVEILTQAAIDGVMAWEEAGIAIGVILARTAAQIAAMLAVKEAQEFEARLDIIVNALDRLGRKFGDIAQIIGDAWKVIGNTKKDPVTGENIVSNSDKWVMGLSAASAATNLFVTGTDRASSATRGLMAGMAAGAAIGSMIMPGIGMAIGAVGGAIAGLVSGWNSAGKAAREANREADKTLDELRDKLLVTYGTMENLSIIGRNLGVDLAGAWGDTTVAGLEHFGKLVDEFEKKLAALQSTLQKYGMTWIDLGEDIRQFFGADMGGNLVEEFNSLVGSGVAVEKVLKGMSGAISEYIIKSIQAGTKIPAAMEPIIKKMIELGYLTQNAVEAMLGLGAHLMPSLADLKAAAERYGLTLDQLGPKVKQLSFTEDATQIVKDFELFIAAGADLNVILSAIPEAARKANDELARLKKLGYDTAAEGSSNWKEYQAALKAVADSTKGMGQRVQELVLQAIKYGLELPESMRPIIQAMIDAGALTDENGDKLKDLSKLTFAKDLSKMFDELIKKLDELIVSIKTGVVPALTDIGNTKIPSIKIPYHYGDDGSSGSGGGQGGGSPQALGGDYWVTKPTLFLAGEAGPEQATFTPGGRRPGNAGSSSVSIVVQAWDGASVDAWLRQGGARKIAESIVPRIPAVVRGYGLT